MSLKAEAFAVTGRRLARIEDAAAGEITCELGRLLTLQAGSDPAGRSLPLNITRPNVVGRMLNDPNAYAPLLDDSCDCSNHRVGYDPDDYSDILDGARAL